MERERAERAIAEFLRALGFEPTTNPELELTPKRVAEAFCSDLLSGYAVDVAKLLQEGSIAAGSSTGHGIVGHGIVAVTGIDVATVCPHHLMPALGTATVAFLPGARLLGLGTLAELVQSLSRRLVLQEQIGESVVSALMLHAGARGAFCRLVLRHSCLSARGAEQVHAEVCTVARAGAFDTPEAWAELSLALSEPPRAERSSA